MGLVPLESGLWSGRADGGHGRQPRDSRVQNDSYWGRLGNFWAYADWRPDDDAGIDGWIFDEPEGLAGGSCDVFKVSSWT